MPEKKEAKKKSEVTKEKYFYGVGRRKTAIARVRIYPSKKASDDSFIVNQKNFADYFKTLIFQNIVSSPFKAVGLQDSFNVSVIVRGGGPKGQAEAVRLGIARAIVEFNNENKKTLKDLGYLTRDDRKVERKKPGLKKARRAPQWQKR